ncbi:MAG: ester cyclase [Pseudomonadota bacterium]
MLYNNSSLLQQLGHDLQDTVPQLCANAPAGWPRDAATWQDLRAATSPAVPISIAEPANGFDVDRFARGTMEALWNQRDYEVLGSAYDEGFQFAGPTDRAFAGARPYRELHASLIQAFPDLELQVDEVYWMGNEKDGFLTSERWSAEATHTGDGLYGEATGKTVQIWGITQHRIRDGRIDAEWMLFNELDLMMQLAATS